MSGMWISLKLKEIKKAINKFDIENSKTNAS